MNDKMDEMDDPYDRRPPPGPSLNELRKQAAERGDVDYFLDIFGTQIWSLISVNEMLRYLMRAAEVRARADPEGYARELFGKMVEFNSFLLMRTQIFIIDRVVGRGPMSTTSTVADLANDVIERFLPRMAEIQKATAELLVAQAQSQRLWGLVRAKEAKPEPAAFAPPTKSRPLRPPKGKGRCAGCKAVGANAEVPRDVPPPPTRGRRRG